MKLFESSWFENYRYYERCLTASGKSECFEIPSQYEYFIPDPKGKYHLITDQTATLTRMEGNSKHAKGNYGVTTPVYKNIRDSYWRDGSYNLEPRTIYLDIETRALNPPPDPVSVPETITLIQMLDSKTKQIIVLGLREWHEEPDYTLEYPVKYIKCDSELVLMQNFLKIFKVMNPLIIYAWNGEGFDFPYLYYRLKKLGLDPNGLSNYGTVRVDYTENLKTHQKSYKLTAPGHYYLDMMAVYKKYVLKPRPSYSLDSIAEIEVHCNKVEHDEFPTFDSFYTGEKYTIQEEPFQERIRESIRQGFIRRKSLDPSSLEYAENEKNLLKDINFQFVYYGVRDVVLLKKIDDKLNFTNITVNIAKTMGVLHNDVLSTVKPWSQYISNVAFYDGLTMPKKEDHEHSSFEGAYVHDPVRGRHKWVMNFDVNSMYPQYSIAGFGMSPETMISDEKMPGDLKAVIDRYFKNKTDDELLNLTEEQWNEVTPLLRKYNFSLTANGVCYSKDTTGIIPKLTNQIYDGRKLDKKTMFKYEQAYVNAEKIINENSASGSESHELKDPLTYTEDDLKSLTVDDLRKFIVMAHDGADRYNTEQMTKKILINALYGATGEPHFSLYNKNYAAGITANGRFFIKQTAIMLEKKLQELLPWDKNYWLYSDTDSVYYTVEPFVNKYIQSHPDAGIQELTDFCGKVADKIVQPVIDESIQTIVNRFNCQDPSRMGAKVEVICDVMINCAKKKYYARIREDEGVRFPDESPKTKIMGLELAKSSTPKWVKDNISKAIPILFDKSEAELKEWIKTVKSSYLKAPISDIAQVGKTNSLDYRLTDKRIPFLARVAIVYNNFVKKNNLEQSFSTIGVGEKFMHIALIKPNPLDTDVTAFPNKNFAELYLKPYIDYDKMFEKTFLQSLALMSECMGYDVFSKVIAIDEW